MGAAVKIVNKNHQQAAVRCPLRLSGPIAEYFLQIPENFGSAAGVHRHVIPELINNTAQMQEASCNDKHHAKRGQNTAIPSNPTQQTPERVFIDLHERGLDQARQAHRLSVLSMR